MHKRLLCMDKSNRV